MRINHFYPSPLTVRSLLALVFFLIVIPACSQSASNKSSQPSLRARTSVEPDERLEQARKKLAEASPEPQTNESCIGPDDLLDVAIFEAPEMNRTVRVSASGEISLQLLGAVKAGGLTPKELESVVQELLRRTYMKDPHVGVFIRELESHPVSVVGAVKKPGVFQIRGAKTVIEVLSMAEGLADDAGDTVLVMHGAGFAPSSGFDAQDAPQGGIAVVPPPHKEPAQSASTHSPRQEKNGEIVEIKLKTLLESSDPSLNVPVRPGDIVKVPRAGIVYVVGEVRKPGGFVLQSNENISVLQALALAEGPTHTSAISQARIIRTDAGTGKRTEIPTNLGKILSGKSPDPILQPKDIVFVPNSAAKSVFYRGSEAALQTAAGAAIYRW